MTTDVAARKDRPLAAVHPTADRLRAALEPAAIWLYGFLVVALAAGSAGGVRLTAFGWMAVTMLWLAAVALVLRDSLRPSLLDLSLVVGLGLFTAWVALSLFWTPSIPSTVHEVQRCLAYFGLVVASLLLVRRPTVPAFLGGVLAGISALCVYAVATRLLPERYGDFETTLEGGYRLAGPITSWNALASFAAIGFLLAFGFAARGQHLATRALAASSMPALALTMYFTFSRGAWLALASGLVVLAVFDARRLQLLATGIAATPWSAIAVLAASRLDGLVSPSTMLDNAAGDGLTLLWLLLALSAVAAAVVVLCALLEPRVTVPDAVRLALAGLLAAVALGGLVTLWATEGSPARLAERGWNAFDAPFTGSSDLTGRLFQLSSNSRSEYWRVAWHRFEQRPVLGEGAGTFWQMNAADGRLPSYTKEGHSLYLETMAELGVPGILLLGVALAVPFVAGARVRKVSLIPPALAAYAAFLTHAAVDPDWELAGLTATGLLVATGVVAAARGTGTDRESLGLRRRIPPAIALVLLSALASVVLMGDLRVASARAALDTGKLEEALSEARRARRWVPWSSEPWGVAGDAYNAQGNVTAGRASYEKALELDPDNWFLWQAILYRLTGDDRGQALARLEGLNPLAAERVRNPPSLG